MGQVFENTPLARRQWTGLDDEHLASIGFVNFAWNALERKFASLVWVTAGWTQDVGEMVIASMGNVSLVMLFMNLLKRELRAREDRQLWDQGAQTGILFDAIRDARNDMIHSFFFSDPTSGIEGHFKPSVRKSKTGQAELRTVAMAQGDIDDMCFAISDCFESIDDLILKFWFRSRFLEAPAQAYEQAVHGWQDPQFDLGRLQIYPAKRSQGLRPRQGDHHPPGSTRGEPRRVAGDRGQAAGKKD
ncbi:MAG: hypothetical protein WBQ45_04165 [Roseiarcus sp.]